MSDITKNDIKEAVSEVLTESFPKLLAPFAQAIQKDFQKVDERFDKVEADLSEVKADVKWMKENSSELFGKIDSFTDMYKNQEEQMAVFSKQIQRFEERLLKVESNGK